MFQIAWEREQIPVVSKSEFKRGNANVVVKKEKVSTNISNKLKELD